MGAIASDIFLWRKCYMYEQMRNDFLTELSNEQNVDVEIALRVLDQVVMNYEIKPKEVNIIVFEGELPEIARTYLICKKMTGLTDGTLENYRIILSVFFNQVKKLPQFITANEIREFLYVYQETKNVSRRTIDKYREYITRFFTWAYNEGYISDNPARNIAAIKYEEKPREALTQVELEYLRMACETVRERAIIEFLYSTGARVSELTVIKKSDINWYEKSVRLFGKGRKHRVSFLNAKAEVALIKYLESRNDDSEFLFVGMKRPYNKLSKDGIEKIVRNIAKRASKNIGKHITPHILRHTTATMALQSGMPISDISKLLGHESIDTTMIYAKSSLEDVRSGHKKYIV
jgi:integrase/recombinase XerD